MDELQNGIQYGVKYHTFYSNASNKEKKKKLREGDKGWDARNIMYIICMIMALAISIPGVLKGNIAYMFLLAFCILFTAFCLFMQLKNLALLDKVQVCFDETGVQYTYWAIGRTFRTERVNYADIGRIYIGGFPMAGMPRRGRQRLMTKEICKEVYGTYINVTGPGTNVLFSLQYTEERLQFLLEHCKEDLPVMQEEEFYAFRKNLGESWQ